MQCAFQVGEIDVGINNQPFHLVEHWGVSLIVIVTIYAARGDNTDRRLFFFHGADLHAGSLCAQQTRRVKPESVVVSARRVMARNVERIEVMIVIFDFRTGRHGKAQLTEETFNPVDCTRYRVQTAVFDTTPRKGNIDRFFSQTSIQRSTF